MFHNMHFADFIIQRLVCRKIQLVKWLIKILLVFHFSKFLEKTGA